MFSAVLNYQKLSSCRRLTTIQFVRLKRTYFYPAFRTSISIISVYLRIGIFVISFFLFLENIYYIQYKWERKKLSQNRRKKQQITRTLQNKMVKNLPARNFSFLNRVQFVRAKVRTWFSFEPTGLNTAVRNKIYSEKMYPAWDCGLEFYQGVVKEHLCIQ